MISLYIVFLNKIEMIPFYLDDISISKSETEVRLLLYKCPVCQVRFMINLYILSFLWPTVSTLPCFQDFFL